MVKILTHYWAKPIPPREYDWEAITEDYDGPGFPVGYGRTEAEAVADLREQLVERA